MTTLTQAAARLRLARVAISVMRTWTAERCGDLHKRFPRRSELSLDASGTGMSIDIEAAASRIRGYVRRTPMIEVVKVCDAPTPNPLYLTRRRFKISSIKGATLKGN
jgi:hypothetical protein